VSRDERRSGRFRFHALLNRGVHRLKVPLSFLDYVLGQPPNEQARERLGLLKMGAAGYGREVNAMRTVEDAANQYTATPAKVLSRANDQNSRLEDHRIRSIAEHNADCLSLPEVAVDASNEGIPIGIRGAIRYNAPDIGRRTIDDNASMHATILVEDKKGANCA